jgi:hypothetical protein
LQDNKKGKQGITADWEKVMLIMESSGFTHSRIQYKNRRDKKGFQSNISLCTHASTPPPSTAAAAPAAKPIVYIDLTVDEEEVGERVEEEVEERKKARHR